MRFADIAIDLTAVLSASRSVASKHIALRARQLDRYSRTSSLVRDFGRPDARPATRSSGADVTSAEKPAADDTSSAASSWTPEDSPRHATEAAQQPSITRQAAPPSLTSRLRTLGSALDEKLRDDVQRIKQRAAGSVGEIGQVTDAPAVVRSPTTAATSRTRAEAAVADAVAVEEEDVPEGININVFQTPRGSRILGALNKASPESKPGFKGAGPKAAADLARNSPWPPKDYAPQTSDTSPVHAAEDLEPASGARIETHAASPPFTAPIASIPPARTEETPEAVSPARPTYQLRESKVPATRLGRLWNYGGLAAGMLGGALSESISRSFGGGSSEGSVMLNPANMERLVAKLSRMRGAALKMGQVMSFQDDKMLPGPIQQVLQRVQDRADYMPAWQRDRVLTTDLGADWRAIFDTFEEKPIAAASIGQVHRATLKSTGQQVAVKIQFPGVANSINSDLDNIGMLLVASNLLPRGLYLDKTIANARTELAWECDYEREAACVDRYRELLSGRDDAGVFVVPAVYPEASGKHVLTMEFMSGVGVTRVEDFSQEQRDWIGTQIMGLCLREIAEFRFMQTDPNWTNFLYNAATRRLELLDFGASREYPDEFVSQYVRLLHAASMGDREGVRVLSQSLGYLTGLESRAMLDAHVQSVLTLAEPFLGSAPEVYDFRGQTITERVRALIPIMIRERLAPPPEETYSLHRKLSGAFLLCARLGSRVRCRDLFVRSLSRSGFVPELTAKR